MRTIILSALLSSALVACTASYAAPEGDGDIVLDNRTGSDLLFLALERESSDVVDPAPSWRVAEHPDRRVEAGRTRSVEVEGYTRGDDVRLFLYRVGDPSGEAPLARVLTVTDAELRRASYRVVVDRL